MRIMITLPGRWNDTCAIKFFCLSAYEVKTNCCSFERLFKVKKNSVFFLEIFAFLYYANEESDDVIGGSTKTVQRTSSVAGVILLLL